ncbi:branched-chain amino acid ABC superfamily ATP binding cassette transporter, ABC protein [Bordetella holmesii 41130]|nr:branched-chain amino acid ABC superfamily ATP binding cassette transporter, ABC protein [Bordetella holmesii 41130]
MLAIEDMAISYGPMRALRGVSMHIGQGEIVALLGANGAGKSSLLRGIMGLMPAAGALRFEGRDLCGLSTPERVMAGLAMAPEGRQVFTDQTVHENLLLGGYLIRHDRPAWPGRLKAISRCSPGSESAVNRWQARSAVASSRCWPLRGR